VCARTQTKILQPSPLYAKKFLTKVEALVGANLEALQQKQIFEKNIFSQTFETFSNFQDKNFISCIHFRY
jgi:hypothetical protein